jgi:hypothetical protein
MDAVRLVEGYKTILRTIYSPGEYYRRALESLKRMGRSIPKPLRGSVAGNLAALARLVVALGLRDGERREFWLFMREVIMSHREKFADAVMLAALGYHFRKITELYCGPPRPEMSSR